MRLSASALALFAVLALSLPASAQSGRPAYRIGEVENSLQGVEYLARYYRQQRVVGGVVGVTSGVAATTIGLVGLASGEGAFSQPVIPITLFTSGVGSLTFGAMQLVAPVTDAEVRARQLAADPDATEDDYRRFIANRAALARRMRIVGATGIETSGLALIIAGVVYDYEAAGFKKERASVSIVAGALLMGVGVAVAVVPSTEERVARRLDVERTRLRRASLSVSPLVAQHRGESYRGLSLGLQF